MTLKDQILDEARALAENRILNDPTDFEIVDAISDIVNIKLAYNSVGAHLAICQYNRYDVLNHMEVVRAR